MSPTAIIITYVVGVVCSLFYVGIKFDDIDWDASGPMPIVSALVWPAAAPVVIGMAAARVGKVRAQRRKLAEQEKSKWLETPLP